MIEPEKSMMCLDDSSEVRKQDVVLHKAPFSEGQLHHDVIVLQRLSRHTI